jgi:hypothetical protein
MTALRLYLVLAWTLLVTFTAYVIGREGLAGLGPTFFGDIAAARWPGQFNADFLSMLALAALWAGWRNGWTVSGWVLALLAFNLGGTFLMAYLLILLHLEKGDMRRVLLGNREAGKPGEPGEPGRRWTD